MKTLNLSLSTKTFFFHVNIIMQLFMNMSHTLFRGRDFPFVEIAFGLKFLEGEISLRGNFSRGDLPKGRIFRREVYKESISTTL